MAQRSLRVVCLSDTHLRHGPVPMADILLHAGDMTARGSAEELMAFNSWLGTLPHLYKIVVAGNHDVIFHQQPKIAQTLLTNATYLQDQLAVVEGLRIWGSPWQPEFRSWAFNVPRGPHLRAIWERIPQNLDFLVTHAPPAGICDRTVDGESIGCTDLRDVVGARRPRVHIFGHVHEARGIHTENGTIFVNASICHWGDADPRSPIVLSCRGDAVWEIVS